MTPFEPTPESRIAAALERIAEAFERTNPRDAFYEALHAATAVDHAMVQQLDGTTYPISSHRDCPACVAGAAAAPEPEPCPHIWRQAEVVYEVGSFGIKRVGGYEVCESCREVRERG